MLRRSGRALAAVWGGFAEEIMIALGVALVGAGFWWVWPPGMFFAAGVIVLWIFLPPRWPLITRPPVPQKPKRTRP